MPTIGQVAGFGSTGLGVALPLLTSLSNPVSAGIAAGVGLIALVDKIGQGRKAANKFTQKGGPQDIINKQLAAISKSAASAEEKAQATDKAWRDFLGAANQFAAANPKQSTVVKQAIYKTPELTQTVQGLLGRNPLDQEYTSIPAQGISIGEMGRNPGPSVGGTVLRAGLTAGLPFAMDAVRGALPGTGAAGSPEWNPTTGQWETVPAVNTGGAMPESILSRILPDAISAGTNLLGGVLQSRAAGRAADVQSEAALEAARLNSQAGREALQFNREALAQQQANAQPWIDAGTDALRRIGDISREPGFTREFRAPTPEEAMQDPGIQFQLDRGSKALEQSLRSKGMSLSGKAVKEINEQAQNIAAQGYDRVYGRARDEFTTAYNVFSNERAARLNPLLSVAGLGQTSANQLNDAVQTGGTNAGNITLGTAARTGDLSTSAAAARASGYVGGANAIGTAIGQIGNNVMDRVTIDQLMRRLGGNA